MTQFANAMAVFKLLDKSNCRKCNETTCLAFASKVFLGQKTLDLCPGLEPAVIKKYQGNSKGRALPESDQEKILAALKNQLKDCDLKGAAIRTGGAFDPQKKQLTLRIFGKPFSLDNMGSFKSDLHINPWIVMPVINYVLHCQGSPATGKWVPFRELEKGREKNGLFVQRAEKPLKKIADAYPGLLEDLILIFKGEKTQSFHDSDISLVLYPLPRIPLLICYYKPEGGMASDLHIFFDKSADRNGGIDVIFELSTGIVQMFEKFSLTHGPGKG